MMKPHPIWKKKTKPEIFSPYIYIKMNSQKYLSDFLVIGSGIAGLTFAIKASVRGSVNIVTKKKDFESNTNYAQGGIASVISPDDSFESHINDTLQAGALLGDRESVEILVRSGPDRIRELIEWGTAFSTKKPGGTGSAFENLDLGREGGHSRKRIIHSTDLTGSEIERALLKKISDIPNIRIFENSTAVDLLTGHQLKDESDGVQPVCRGAYILDNESGVVNTFNAKITLIASGGIGRVYLHTSNPSIATGDGIAMAYTAGAAVADMEFIQFHPTTLYSSKNNGISFLISEAVRGEGAVLLNRKGKRFMEGVHPREELAPRDVVARAIDTELKLTGDPFVYLDISFKDREFLENRFPGIYNHCLKEGIDISKEPIPVVPAAHYICGGIVTDKEGRTGIKNLYAAGESARTGVHGANRLASNSLLEGVVFSHRAAMDGIKRLDEKDMADYRMPEYPFWDKKGTFDLKEWVLVQHNMEEIKRLMWDYVGIVRSDRRLQNAWRRIILLTDEIYEYYKKSTLTPELVELRNLAVIARIVIRSAMMRKHSIGLHYNSDHPEPDKKKRVVVLESGKRPEFINAKS